MTGPSERLPTPAVTQRLGLHGSEPAGASPSRPRTNPILRLQRAIGNRGVAELIRTNRLSPDGRIASLQAKVTVGAVDDPLEHEAEQVSREVMSMPEATHEVAAGTGEPTAEKIQTKSAAPTLNHGTHGTRPAKDEDEEGKEEHKSPMAEGNKLLALRGMQYVGNVGVVSRQTPGSQGEAFDASPDVETQLSQSKGRGSPLPDSVLGFMEPRFGADFSHVRVHTDGAAGQMNRSIGAEAFTHGADIYYGANRHPGQLDLTSHELAHVVQQGGLQRLPREAEHSHWADSGTADAGARNEPYPVAARSGVPFFAGSAMSRKGAPAGVLHRSPPQQWPTEVWPSDQVFASVPDITLFKQIAPASKPWSTAKEFEPLPSGVIIVDGIPITYGIKGNYSAQTDARLSFGPAMLEQIRLIVTGPEAERMRSPRIAPNPLPLIGPPIIVLPPDRSTPHGSFAAEGMLRFDALAHAEASAGAELKGQVGLFGALNAGAFAGMRGSARGDVWSHVSSFVQIRWSDGAIKLSAVLDVTAGLQLAFLLTAYAGVEVELRIPEIPVVTKLTEKVQSWPIIGWFVPDLEHWKWSKRYQKDWPLLNKSYTWEVQQKFVVGESAGTAAIENPEGFDMGKVLADLQAQQKAGDLKDDPAGPGKEKRNGDTGAVSAAKAEALAQIGSAKRATTREKQANARLLTAARKAKAAAAASSGSSKTPALAAASVTTGPADPVTALEKRDKSLEDAAASTEELRHHADELGGPATAPDGVSRNEARAGFESIAKNADTLSDTINRNEDVFAVPAAAEPSDAEYAAMTAARIKANEAFDACYDLIRTEKLFADDQVREAGTDADLHPYRDAVVAYQSRALAVWNRVEKLENTIEVAREIYEKHDYAMGVIVFDEIETKLIVLKDDGETLKKERPVGDWDADYVELSGGHLQLMPQFRGKATRATFYPHDYSSATQNRMWLQIGGVRTGEDHKQYWEYPHKRSPRGDFQWLVDDPTEMPTLDHTAPTVVSHWNQQGRTTTYGPRSSFYDFEGASQVVVVPKSLNSSSGAKDANSYTPLVTRSFRGSKR